MKAPKCRSCGESHWGNCSGISVGNVATLVKKVATITEKPFKPMRNVATSNNNIATIRRVSIRELNQGISAQFSNLPFEVTKNGKVIAIVKGK